MTFEHELKALQVALRDHLERVTGLLAYPDQAPAGVDRPYLIFFWMGGGRVKQLRGPVAEIVMGVKCVAEDMGESLHYAGVVAGALDDVELKGGLTAPGWEIVNCTGAGMIHQVEAAADGAQLYHDGNQYRFRMEAV